MRLCKSSKAPSAAFDSYIISGNRKELYNFLSREIVTGLSTPTLFNELSLAEIYCNIWNTFAWIESKMKIKIINFALRKIWTNYFSWAEFCRINCNFNCEFCQWESFCSDLISSNFFHINLKYKIESKAINFSLRKYFDSAYIRYFIKCNFFCQLQTTWTRGQEYYLSFFNF